MKKGDQNKILWHSHRSWRSYYQWFIFVIVYFYLGFIFGPFFLLFLVSFLVIVLHRHGSEYYITSKRIIFFKNFAFLKKRSIINIHEIQKIDVNKDTWGVLFGHGYVSIYDRYDNEVVFKGLIYPEKIGKLIRDLSKLS